MKKGFTLAEILITLAIIGVVAALTIPTLILENQQKGWNTASTLFERKMEEALKIMNTQQILSGYSSTEDFVTELSNHLKIIKTCKNDELTSCFEEKVYWGDENEEIEISSLSTASNFGQNDWNTNLIGIQLANGTSGIIAYNPNCKQDPYNNKANVNGCIAILYDTSGNSKPNTQNKDLRSINVAQLGNKFACSFKVGNTCWSPTIAFQPLTNAQCREVAPPESCNYSENDYWAGAYKACKDIGGRLPSESELWALGREIYGETIDENIPSVNRAWDKEKLESYGFNTARGEIALWSSAENGGCSFNIVMTPNELYRMCYTNDYNAVDAMCVR